MNRLFHRYDLFCSGSHRNSTAKKQKTYRLGLESLEERCLLSVTAAEYDLIRTEIDDFALPEFRENVNIIELNDLSYAALQNGINEALASDGDNILLLRSSDDGSNTILVGETPLTVDFGDSLCVNLTIIGWSGTETQSVNIDLGGAALTVFDVSNGGALRLANLNFINMDAAQTYFSLITVDSPETYEYTPTVVESNIRFIDTLGEDLSQKGENISLSDYVVIADSNAAPDGLSINPTGASASDNYAVLFVGGINPSGNVCMCYKVTKDLYSVLTKEYNIPKSNIYLLFADGTDPKADNEDGQNSDFSYASGSNIYAATRSNFKTIMTTVAGKMTSSKHLFVLTYDHGAGEYNKTTDYNDYLCSWITYNDNAFISGAEFAEQIYKIKSGYVTITSTQCYSGGIIDNVINPSTGKVYTTYNGSAHFYCMAAANHYEGAGYDEFFYTEFTVSFVNAISKTKGRGLKNTQEVFEDAKSTCIYSAKDENYNNNEGRYRQASERIQHPWGAGESFDIFVSAAPTPSDKPDLIAYCPTGWTDKIVITDSENSITNSAKLTTSSNIYFKCAYKNNGKVSTSTFFSTKLTLSGNSSQSKTYTRSTDLSDGYYNKGIVWNIGTLAAGNYTITMFVDSGYAISESDESNNKYSVNFTIQSSGIPDLTFGNYSGWNAPLIVSNSSASTTSLPVFSTDDTVYFNCRVLNAGIYGAGAFYCNATLKGSTVSTSKTVKVPFNDGLSAGYSICKKNGISLGKLSAGDYSLTLVVDPNNQVKESNENNNTYTISFTVIKSTIDITVPATLNSKTLNVSSIFPYNAYGTWKFNQITANSMVSDVAYVSGSSSSSLKSASKTVTGTLGVEPYLKYTVSRNTTTSERVFTHYIYYGTSRFTVNLRQEAGFADDSFESNNTFNTAANLGTLTAAKSYSNLVLAPGDLDWYKFTISATGTSGDSVKLTYSHVAYERDLDLFLYNSSNTLLASSRKNTGTESISLAGLAAGTYYIKVENYNSGYLVPSYSLLISPPATSASTYTVTSTADTETYGTLRYGLKYCEDGATIKFSSSLNGATIKLNGDTFYLKKSMTIDASSLSKGVILDANGKNHIFFLSDMLSISSVKSKVTFKNLTFKNANNAAIALYLGPTAYVYDCVFYNNYDGISSIGATLYVERSVFDHNTNYGIWAFVLDDEPYESLLTITDSVFSHNRHGIECGSNTNTVIYNSAIFANDCGIEILQSDVTIINSTIAKNKQFGIDCISRNYILLYNSIAAQNTNEDIYTYGENQTIMAFNSLSSFTDWDLGLDNLEYNPSLPLFNSGSENVTLAPNSQAIGMGNKLYARNYNEETLSSDLAGNSRFTNGAVDIGAYQYGATGNAGILFDIDGDGKVNSTDAIMLRRYTISPNASGIVDGFTLANRNKTEIFDYITAHKSDFDIDGDGDMDSADAIMLRRYTISPNASGIVDGFTLKKENRDQKQIFSYIQQRVTQQSQMSLPRVSPTLVAETAASETDEQDFVAESFVSAGPFLTETALEAFQPMKAAAVPLPAIAVYTKPFCPLPEFAKSGTLSVFTAVALTSNVRRAVFDSPSFDENETRRWSPDPVVVDSYSKGAEESPFDEDFIYLFFEDFLPENNI